MSDIMFRPTDAPEQEDLFDPFSELTNRYTNKITRLLLAPVYRPDPDTKILPMVCPGGYKGVECFRATYEGTILTLSPGYLIMDEVLLESKKSITIDVSDPTSYFDNIPTVNQPYSGYSPFSGTSGISGISGSSNPSNYAFATVYILAYYYPYNKNNSQYKDPVGYSGYSQANNTEFTIGLSSNKNTYLYNRDRYCFLYSMKIAFNLNTVLYIESINYYDTNNSHMKRNIPNFIVNN